MKNRQRIFIGTLFIFLILLGINYFKRPFEKIFDIKESPLTQEDQIREPVALTKHEILEKLSIKEKIAQMISQPLVIESSSKFSEFSKSEEIIKEEFIKTGFFTIFGDNISSESAKQKILDIESKYQDNLLSPKFAVDHEGGKVQRLNGEGYTILPTWNALCSIKDTNELKKILKSSAKELRDTGIDIVLAPVLDVGKSKPLKNRICSDSYAVVADRSIEYTSAFTSYGILPVLKHFPGIGNVSNDLHTEFDFIKVSDNDVKLYNYVIDQSPRVGVMISHVGVINQDPGIPCSLSIDCVREIKNAFPNVLLFTDALEMKSASFDKENNLYDKDLVAISTEAVIAGNDILIYGESVTSSDIEKIIIELSDKYNKDTIFKSIVDEAVLKIIDLKYSGEQI